MGAIFGIVGEGSKDEVRAMGNLMPHRGFSQKVWSPRPGVYFGQRDNNKGYIDSDELIIGDCNIDNSCELCDRILRNPDLSDNLQIIKDLLQRFGKKSLRWLRGCFSIVLWNEQSQTLLLSCDQAGFKSIYYVQLPTRFAFSSEYKALFALDDFVAEPDRDVIQYYLSTMRYKIGQSFMAKVKSIMPGEVLEWHDGNLQSLKYWQATVKIVQRKTGEHVRLVRDSLLNVVQRQSRPYSRIGLTLSAGIDSAALLAALRNVKPEAEILTFVVGYGSDDPEIIGASEVARYFKTEHREIIFLPELIPQELPRLVWLMEDCAGREEAILQLIVISEAGIHVPVVMGGHGADRIFGGMPRYRLVRFAERLPWAKKPLEEFYQLTQTGSEPKSIVGKCLDRFLLKGKRFPPPQIKETSPIRSIFWRDDLNEYSAKMVMDSPTYNYVEPAHEMVQAAFHTPFLDPDYIDLAFTIPSNLKVSWLKQKIILRKATEDLLPNSILNRPKAIQRIEHNQRLSDILDSMCDQLLTSEIIRDRELFDSAYIRSVRHRTVGKAYSTGQLYRIWALISMEIWAQQFLDRRGEPWGFVINREI